MNPAPRPRTVLALGTTQTLAWGSTYYLPAILAVPMARDLDLSTGWVFGAFSAALMIAAILGPMAGRRIDDHGGRDVLTVSNLIFALGLVLLGLAEGAALLTVGWLVLGTGMAMGLYEGAFSTLAGLYGRDARGSMVGVALMAGFASTICWPVTAYLEITLGWRSACFFWAGMHLFIGLPINRFLIPQPVEPQTHTGTSPAGAVIRPDLAMILLATFFAIVWFISTAMAAHLPRLLMDTGLSPAAAVAAAALLGPAQVAARLLDYLLFRRFHPLLSARIASLAHPVGALAMLVLGAPAATFFAVLHGAGNGILTIAKGTLPLAIFGPLGYGLRLGMLMAPARFVQAGAPFLFILLMERYGVYALTLTAVLGIVALGALSVLNPADRHR